MRHPGRVFNRTEILEFFQDHAWEGYERTIDVHIKNIRKALEPDRNDPIYLETVRGVGYRVSDTPPEGIR
jgi:DNA-binding response OmpR family regulator